MECDLKLTTISAIISANLAKFIQYNTLNAAYFYEIVIILSQFYLLRD